jgi:hypothetical protein
MKRVMKEARHNRIRPMLPADLGEVSAGSEISQPIMLLSHDLEAVKGGSEVSQPILLVGNSMWMYPN